VIHGRSVDDNVAELLDKGFYSSAFQPILDTRTERVFGFEALLRAPEETPLNRPELIFNRDGYISEDLKTRLDLACVHSAVRTSRHLPAGARIFINVLGRTIKAIANDLDAFLGLLLELNVSPDRIVLEISETTGQNQTDDLVAYLAKLRKAHIAVALDDIGIRYPYFYHLLCLEPNFIKLDRTFVRAVDTDRRKQTLIGCLAFMAKQMDAELITEGVETFEEFETLRGLGVPLMQGFLIGYPANAERWAGTLVQGELPVAVRSRLL